MLTSKQKVKQKETLITHIQISKIYNNWINDKLQHMHADLKSWCAKNDKNH